MKMARTAAVAGVELPKMSRNSRNHIIWYTSAQAPEQNSSAVRNGTRMRAENAIRVGSIDCPK